MKNTIILTSIIMVLSFMHLNVNGQFVLTGKIGNIPTDTFHICIGDTLDLNSSKSDYLMNNNFNNSTLGTGWSTNILPMWTNPCPPTNSPAQGVVLWFGSNAFPRELVTVSYDIHCYDSCYVEFDMKYGANQNSTNCESPDEATEGVKLMYSVTGGPPWTAFPGVDQSGTGGYWTPVPGNAATGPYYSWNHYRSKIPVPGISTNTKIRWYQNLASGNTWDHWGIDNVQISCPMDPYIEWRCVEKPTWFWFDFNPTPFIVNQPGTYHYIVSIIDLLANNHCQQSDTVVVIVHDPKVNAIPDLEICAGDTTLLTAVGTSFWPLTYEWNTLPVITVNNLTVSPDSTTKYIITVEDNIGCKAKDSVLVTVHPLPVIVTTSDTICIGDTAMLTATAGEITDRYLWSNADTTSSILITPIVTTIYQLKITTQYGCKDTSSATAVVNPLPIVQLTNNKTICFGDQIPLTAGGGKTYLWNPTGETTATITVSPITSFASYKVIVTDSNLCTDSASVELTSIPIPIPTISKEIDTLCKGAHTIISAGGGTSYLWNTGDVTPSIDVVPLITSVYTVSIINSQNNVVCSKDTSIQQIVRNCNVIYVPNSFSPSGYNTIFKPIGEIVISKTYRFAIYNRWGQMVFETTDIQKGWDGKYNGEYVQSGAYIYYLNIDNGFDDPYEKIGTVTVIQ